MTSNMICSHVLSSLMDAIQLPSALSSITFSFSDVCKTSSSQCQNWLEKWFVESSHDTLWVQRRDQVKEIRGFPYGRVLY